MIRFYRANDVFGEFSNFYPSAITVDGMVYDTVEHLYQTSKFTDPEYRAIVRESSTPNKAFILGNLRTGAGGFKWRTELNTLIAHHRGRGVTIRRDWNEVRESVMRMGLREKFTRHKVLKDLLLSTGDKRLVEDSPRDPYWGVGKDGRGLNRLGELLMELRASLRTSHLIHHASTTP